MATCPACEAEIEVEEFGVEKGDEVNCPECGEALEVTNLSPVELELVSDDEDEEELEKNDLSDLDEEDDEDEEDLDQ